jgi:hypothetical protein
LIYSTGSWKEIVALKDKTDIFTPNKRLVIIGQVRDIDSVEEISSFARIIEHPDDIHKCRFSTSRLTHYRDELPFIYLDIDSLQNIYRLFFPELIRFDDIMHLDEWRHKIVARE